MMQRTDLAGLIDSLGPAAFYEKTRDLLAAGTLSPDDFQPPPPRRGVRGVWGNGRREPAIAA